MATKQSATGATIGALAVTIWLRIPAEAGLTNPDQRRLVPILFGVRPSRQLAPLLDISPMVM